MPTQAVRRTQLKTLAVAFGVFAGSLGWLAPSLELASGTSAAAQATASPNPGTRIAGTVTAVAGNVLTVKDDKGAESKVTVSDTARVLQLPAGAKNLSGAIPIKVADVAVGDRILAKTTPDGQNYIASTLVAMKQADVAKVQQTELQDWRTKGVNGLVRSVDPAAMTVSISTGGSATAKAMVIQATKSTTIRRYAADSTKFDDAKPATLEDIKPGDQLRAKGDKNEDGTQVTADAIVAGTFHNIAGTVISVDPAANKVVVNDLATKKPFTIDVNADTQMHKLSPMMAQGIAMRLKGGSGPSGGGQTAQNGASAPAGGAAQPNGSSGGNVAGGWQGRRSDAAGGQSPAGAPGQRGGDVQQMLNRAPTLALADLKKGDAVMVLTTEGQTPIEATAVTLLAGVEPLLQASPGASQSVLSASWNLGGGAAAGGQDAQ